MRVEKHAALTLCAQVLASDAFIVAMRILPVSRQIAQWQLPLQKDAGRRLLRTGALNCSWLLPARRVEAAPAKLLAVLEDEDEDSSGVVGAPAGATSGSAAPDAPDARGKEPEPALRPELYSPAGAGALPAQGAAGSPRPSSAQGGVSPATLAVEGDRSVGRGHEHGGAGGRRAELAGGVTLAGVPEGLLGAPLQPRFSPEIFGLGGGTVDEGGWGAAAGGRVWGEAGDAREGDGAAGPAGRERLGVAAPESVAIDARPGARAPVPSKLEVSRAPAPRKLEVAPGVRQAELRAVVRGRSGADEALGARLDALVGLA
jgi:hypothetical protein